MKYMVWFLINPYDGYAINEFDSWEEALADVKRQLQETDGAFDLFLASESGKLALGTQSEIFITSGPIPVSGTKIEDLEKEIKAKADWKKYALKSKKKQ